MSKKPETPQAANVKTIAELYCYLPTAAKRNELERFRVEYETEHGPTDYSKKYSSRLSQERQRSLIERDPKKWFDGLPPFVQDFFKQKIESTANSGKLDGLPGEWISNYVLGGTPGKTGPSRER